MAMQVSVRLTHIHAERLVEKPPPKLGINIQITLPSAEPRWGDNSATISYSFNLSTMPPAFTITLRGAVEVRADAKDIERIKKGVKEGKLPPEIASAVTNFTVFEAMLLARELGFPPILPISQLPKPRPSPMTPV